MDYFFVVLLGVAGLMGGGFLYWRSFVRESKLESREKSLARELYHLWLIRKVNEHKVYTVREIADILLNTIHHFREFNTASYLFWEKGELLYRVQAEKAVPLVYLKELEDTMRKTFSALTEEDISKQALKKVFPTDFSSGEMVLPQSFLFVPLREREEVVGLIALSHSKKDFYTSEDKKGLRKIVEGAAYSVAKVETIAAIEERRLNAMVASMVEGVVMTDRDYKIVVVNPAAKKVIGHVERDSVTLFDFIDKLGRAFAIKGKLEESVRLKKVIVEDDVLIDGRFFQIFISPVESHDESNGGEIIGSVIIFHDITHEKEAERMRKDFISMVVHELRTPLGNIRKVIDTILKEGLQKKAKTYEQYLSMAHESSIDMLGWINDLLDVAKIESGKFEVRRDASNIKEIIDERVKFYELSAEDAQIKISAQISEDMPQNVLFDAERVVQVLDNLMGNSMKFTSKGGAITVQAFMHKKGKDASKERAEKKIEWIGKGEKRISSLPDSLVISITDTGVGIAHEDIPHLFNRFAQMQSRISNKKKKGTGLGLVISKGIVEAHEGIIGVFSEVDEGSTFYFTLPAVFHSEEEKALPKQ